MGRKVRFWLSTVVHVRYYIQDVVLWWPRPEIKRDRGSIRRTLTDVQRSDTAKRTLVLCPPSSTLTHTHTRFQRGSIETKTRPVIGSKTTGTCQNPRNSCNRNDVISPFIRHHRKRYTRIVITPTTAITTTMGFPFPSVSHPLRPSRSAYRPRQYAPRPRRVTDSDDFALRF